MKLHELSPAEGSKKSVKRIGRGTASGQGKTAGKGQKVRRPVPVTADGPALKVVRCPFSVVCQKRFQQHFCNGVRHCQCV